MIQAENKIVWDVIEPILQLTSHYLDNAHLWPWYVQYCVRGFWSYRWADKHLLRWDALLSDANSDNKRTEQSPHNTREQNLHFRVRKPEEASKQTEQVKELLRAMSGHWFLKMRSMFRNPTNGGPMETHWLGVTTALGGPGKGSITLSSELIMVLLRKDLTV